MPEQQPMQQPTDAQPDQPGSAPEGQDQGAGQVVNGMMAINSAMSGMLPALSQDKNIPSEALNALKTAIESYQKFLSLTMKSMGVEGAPDVNGPDEGAQGSQDSMSSGGKNVISADQMMGGRNAKPA